jgi:glucose/arabinose dehydrogenase/plastocyanin
MKTHMSFLAAGLCLTVLCGPSALRAATVHVDIIDFGFSPQDVTVTVGDTVTWVNTGSYNHTTTSGTTAGGPHPDGLWDSGYLSSGASYSHTFTQVGTYPYYCAPHYTHMTGTVTVKPAANVAPTIAITSPANGASLVSPATVAIQASASDADGTVAKVEFYVDDNSVGSVTASPYAKTVTLYPGTYVLTAAATDNLGATTTSDPVVVIVRVGAAIADPLPNRIPKGDVTIELQTVADGLIAPLGLAVPDDGSGRLFVYDQGGLAWVLTRANERLAAPLLDVRTRLVPFGVYDERGLLGLATHPDFVHHPLVYTFTSEPNTVVADFVLSLPAGVKLNCQSVLAEWRIDPNDPNRIDPASRREVLRIDKAYSNHNGGTLRFGPDGFLYVSLGDGGRANDTGNGHAPGGNAQDLQRIWGKIIRIDVDGRNSANGKYGIPKDNPFVGQNAVQEIFAYGLRNPFTFSFDSATGLLYVGDAGQNTVEEVDLIVKGGNYGWNVKEGSFWFDPNSGKVVTGPVRPVPPDLIDPLAQYDHGDGSVVIGGFVYHGSQIPALKGHYVFGDWGSFTTPSARLFFLDSNLAIKELRIGIEDRPTGFWLRGLGQDEEGELYIFGSTVLGPSGSTGQMLKVVAP